MPGSSPCSMAFAHSPRQQEEGLQRSSSSNGSVSAGGPEIAKPVLVAKSKYRGVSRSSADNKWRVRIHLQGKQVHIGRFDDEAAAARAYDNALLHAFGESASFNFGKEAAIANITPLSSRLAMALADTSISDHLPNIQPLSIHNSSTDSLTEPSSAAVASPETDLEVAATSGSLPQLLTPLAEDPLSSPLISPSSCSAQTALEAAAAVPGTATAAAGHMSAWGAALECRGHAAAQPSSITDTPAPPDAPAGRRAAQGITSTSDNVNCVSAPTRKGCIRMKRDHSEAHCHQLQAASQAMVAQELDQRRKKPMVFKRGGPSGSGHLALGPKPLFNATAAASCPVAAVAPAKLALFSRKSTVPSAAGAAAEVRGSYTRRAAAPGTLPLAAAAMWQGSPTGNATVPAATGNATAEAATVAPGIGSTHGCGFKGAVVPAAKASLEDCTAKAAAVAWGQLSGALAAATPPGAVIMNSNAAGRTPVSQAAAAMAAAGGGMGDLAHEEDPPGDSAPAFQEQQKTHMVCEAVATRTSTPGAGVPAPGGGAVVFGVSASEGNLPTTLGVGSGLGISALQLQEDLPAIIDAASPPSRAASQVLASKGALHTQVVQQQQYQLTTPKGTAAPCGLAPAPGEVWRPSPSDEDALHQILELLQEAGPNAVHMDGIVDLLIAAQQISAARSTCKLAMLQLEKCLSDAKMAHARVVVAELQLANQLQRKRQQQQEQQRPSAVPQLQQKTQQQQVLQSGLAPLAVAGSNGSVQQGSAAPLHQQLLNGQQSWSSMVDRCTGASSLAPPAVHWVVPGSSQLGAAGEAAAVAAAPHSSSQQQQQQLVQQAMARPLATTHHNQHQQQSGLSASLLPSAPPEPHHAEAQNGSVESVPLAQVFSPAEVPVPLAEVSTAALADALGQGTDELAQLFGGRPLAHDDSLDQAWLREWLGQGNDGTLEADALRGVA